MSIYSVLTLLTRAIQEKNEYTNLRSLLRYTVLALLWIIAVGFIPPLLSVWIMRRTQKRMQAELRRAMTATNRIRARRYPVSLPPDSYYLEGVGYLIGDISCRFNARSRYIRCAVNPEGPCQGCRHYEQKEEV